MNLEFFINFGFKIMNYRDVELSMMIYFITMLHPILYMYIWNYLMFYCNGSVDMQFNFLWAIANMHRLRMFFLHTTKKTTLLTLLQLSPSIIDV